MNRTALWIAAGIRRYSPVGARWALPAGARWFLRAGPQILFPAVAALVLAGTGAPRAAAVEVEPRPGARTNAGDRHMILAGFSFNATDEDFHAGGMYRLEVSPPVGLGVFTAFQSRLNDVTVRERIRPHFLIQRDEQSRHLITFGLDERVALDRYVTLFGGAGMGYTFGNLAGTSADPEKGWVPVLHAGMEFTGILCGEDACGVLRAGYRNVDLKSTAPNHLFILIGVSL
jgi:hypothetical protein